MRNARHENDESGSGVPDRLGHYALQGGITPLFTESTKYLWW